MFGTADLSTTALCKGMAVVLVIMTNQLFAILHVHVVVLIDDAVLKQAQMPETLQLVYQIPRM